MPSKIISPNQVEIVHEMFIPEIRHAEESYDSVVLLFPSKDAVEVSKMSEEELKAIKRVVLIDCTWN